MTFSIASVSFFPQYCATKTEPPEAAPNRKRLKIQNICPPREQPDNAFSPTFPSIKTSVAETPTLIRFCNAIGITKANTF